MKQTLALQKATDAGGFAKLNAAAAQSSRTFRDAAASTGMFEVQQLRLNSATDDYIKKLKQQKAGFREIMKSRKIAAAAYKEQLAMEQMTVRQGVGSTRTNKGVYDVLVPNQVSKDLDTASKRLAFMNAELKSGAHQMVNWGKNTQWAGRQLMVGFTMPIAAFGAAAGVMAYQVDKELTRIAKVYDTVAKDAMGVEKELAQVRKDSLNTASEAAKEYGQSATDTLNVQAELAATGKQGIELQQSTLEVMRIARLGEVEHQTAIEATIALQSVFRMSNQELTESFDYMNSIENATSLSTADFATAIPVAASAVKAFGGDVKEMGILLTAMKENGIGASEGANALKATMQRLGRPSKQIREEWAAITGTDITQLVDSSDGLVEVFTKIQAATSGLDPDAQRKAFAGLFGSYQVSKMMALTKGMGELQQGVGQVSDAYAISNQSAEQWAQTADKEVKRYQKSISGMWDTTFQAMKIELAEIGEPFVVLATKIVKGISWILKAFNDMPDFAKYGIATGIAVAALSGGVLMLAGLFGNLAGNLLKGVANLASYALKLNLVTKEGKAAELVAEMASRSYMEQGKSIDLLTMKIEAMTAAQREANSVMLRVDPAFQGAAAGADNETLLRQGQYNQIVGSMRDTDESGNAVYRNPNGGSDPFTRQQAEMHATNVMRERALEMEKAQAKVAVDAADAEKARAANVAKRNKMMAVGTGIMALEGAAMATMMVSSNATVDSVAQTVMLAGMIVPAFSMLAPLAKTFASNMGKAAVAAKGVAVAGIANAKGTVGMAAGATRAATAFNVMKTAMLAMMGPIGWALTAVAAVGFLAYKHHKNAKEEQKKLIDGQKALAKGAENYGTELGYARRELETMSSLAMAGNNEKIVDKFEKARTYYTTSETGKKEVNAFEDMDDDGRQAAAMTMLIQMQQQFEMSAEEAAIAVSALWSEATETTSYEALELMRQYNKELGNVNSADFTGVWAALKKEQDELLDADQFDKGLFTNAGEAAEQAVDNAKGAGTNIGKAFAAAFSASSTPEEAAANTKEFVDMAAAQWNNEFKRLSEDSEYAQAFKTLGITSGQEFAAGMDNPMIADMLKQVQFADVVDGLEEAEVRAREYEKAVISAAAASLNLEPGVDTIAEFMKEAQIATAGMTKEQLIAYVEAQKFKTEMSYATVEAENAAIASATLGINAALAAKGLEQGGDYAEALALWTAYIEGNVKGAAGATGGLAGGLNAAIGPARTLAQALKALSGAEVALAKREAIEGMQDTMSDNITSQMDDQHEAESEANDTYWEGQKDAQSERFDAQTSALDAQHEREQAGMEAAWDAKRKGLENYWDKRIEGVDKAIEAEEKAEKKRIDMFDAEIARINRLADMANTNIDFNVALNEGNLDEAAKIANTAQAKDTEFIWNRERDSGAKKSEKRVERLGDKSEALGEKKDAAMEAFDKREEAAKAHFSKMQEMESASLQKSQDMQADNLEKQAEMSKEALEKDQERQKKNLDKILKAFLAFTPKNKKELQKHAAELGEALKAFGINTLNPMSKKWGEWYKKNISEGMINAANVSKSDAAWADMAKKIKQDILIELGFKTTEDFNKFIQTGNLGKSTGIDSTPRGLGMTTAPESKTGSDGSRHGGGPVGGGKDSRKGVAKNFKGQHSSERLINAQLGEYIVNRDSAKKYGPLLDQINSGNGVGGGGEGPGAFMGAVLARAMLKGVETGLLKKAKEKKAAKAARKAAKSSSGATGSGFSSAGFVSGQGGWQRPSTPGLGWTNTHDYRAGTGTPVYATSDGVITQSHYITSGGSAGNGGIAPNGLPYRSYGETIQLRMADGNVMNFGHLSARYAGAGQQVAGGSLIGRTGNTGNSSGPHLHMDIGGNENASGYLASRGVSLRKGTEYVKYDNTMANLHRGESVMTKGITDKLRSGVDNFANGPQNRYDVTVSIDGYDKDRKALAREVIREIKREAARKPQSRSA